MRFAYSRINSPIIVGSILMIEGVIFLIVPLVVCNFYLDYGLILLKEIFNILLVLFGVGVLFGIYLSKRLLEKGEINDYVIFEKKCLENFLKYFLFSFPLIIMLSAVLIKYVIVSSTSYTETESIFLLSIWSYGGGVCFSLGWMILKEKNKK